MKLARLVGISIAAVCAAASLAPAADPGTGVDNVGEKRAITAMDLLLIRDVGSPYFGGISVSPGGDRLAFQVRQADLDANDYRISWFVADATAGGRAPVRVGDGGQTVLYEGPFGFPVGTLLVEVPRWSPDGRWIVYRLREDGEIQLWRSRIDGAVQERLTNNPADVETFVWAPDGKRIFFQVGRTRAHKRQTDQKDGERGYLFDGRFSPLFGPEPLWGACPPGSPWSSIPADRQCSLSLWVLDLEDGTERRATEQEQDRYAELTSARGLAGAPKDRAVRSVYRSPDGSGLAWLENEDPETYPAQTVPLTVHASTDREFRCSAKECTGYSMKLWWSADGELYILRGEGVALSERAFYGWTPGEESVRPIFRTSDLINDCAVTDGRAICLHAGPTSPRGVVSIDLSNGRMETLVDVNPEFRGIRFTEVEKLEWQDAFGNETFGHLVYPADYQKGRRYPLVIVQYNSRGFLKGGTGNEYPIHLLAAKGFAVLSFDRPSDWQNLGKIPVGLEWEKKEWEGAYEKRRALTALEIIIDRLDERGIIDPDRVGITGLSDGAETLYFSLIHSDRFAAAVASSGSWGHSIYYLTGETYLRDYLPEVGLGRPGGPDDRYWAEHAISLNTDKVRAPLLIHTADHELLAGAVETYMSLKEAGKPVEMFVFPDEYHIKWQPRHRLNIYRRNVQWMKFWLQGVEDPDPVDPEQYARWCELREQHRANQRALEHAQRPAGPHQAQTPAELGGE